MTFKQNSLRIPPKKCYAPKQNNHTAYCQEMAPNPSFPYVFAVKSSCLLNSLTIFTQPRTSQLMWCMTFWKGWHIMKWSFFLYFNNCVTIGELCSIIQRFDYGFMERNDLGLNAVQSLCLLRDVTLIFGYLVTSTDQHWELVLLLLQIVNLFSPMLSQCNLR